ncbi:MAG: hypothetical protein Q9M15_07620 [Mariprofundaceae bacterium]|nr:hypothetical protein [Mariprofundaceae bacterium]
MSNLGALQLNISHPKATFYLNQNITIHTEGKKLSKRKTFKYLYKQENEFSQEDSDELEATEGVVVEDKNIPNPNNEANQIAIKRLLFKAN